jgi:Mg-chelatase subunit ChlD
MDNTTALVKGSLSDIALRDNLSIAESFCAADIVVLIDVSASMSAMDARGGQQRYKVACAELAQLQANLPGKVAVIGFSTLPEFAPTGIPTFQCGSTDLAKGLRLAKTADTGDVRFIVISDGAVDSEQEALNVAFGYQGRIDTVYVGPEADKDARAFLDKLAKAHGGQQVSTPVHLLSERIETLLLTSVSQ